MRHCSGGENFTRLGYMTRSHKPSGPLREGFSTGTAAAAAAHAAVRLLGGLPLPDAVDTALPPFLVSGEIMTQERIGATLRIPVAAGGLVEKDGRTAWATVVKDGGDDPDATHAAHITVRASLQPFAGQSVIVPGAPLAVALCAGTGVGRATLPGLPVPPGEPAINPEPRKQIAFAACEAAKACGLSDALHLEISVPDGEERARRTLNPRLGIVGGISILGTQGIVRPYSHEAWKMTVSQGLAVAEALGLDEALLCTGRRSERLGLGLLTHLPPQAAIQAADFAAHAVRQAGGHSFSRVNWVCFPGKLLKLAQGLEWTHAKSAGADLALLAGLCRRAGGTESLARQVASMPTAAGAFALMEAQPALRQAVLNALAAKAFAALRRWLDEGGGARKHLTLHVFSLEGPHLLSLPSDKERM